MSSWCNFTSASDNCYLVRCNCVRVAVTTTKLLLLLLLMMMMLLLMTAMLVVCSTTRSSSCASTTPTSVCSSSSTITCSSSSRRSTRRKVSSGSSSTSAWILKLVSLSLRRYFIYNTERKCAISHIDSTVSIGFQTAYELKTLQLRFFKTNVAFVMRTRSHGPSSRSASFLSAV